MTHSHVVQTHADSGHLDFRIVDVAEQRLRLLAERDQERARARDEGDAYTLPARFHNEPCPPGPAAVRAAEHHYGEVLGLLRDLIAGKSTTRRNYMLLALRLGARQTLKEAAQRHDADFCERLRAAWQIHHGDDLDDEE